MRRTCPRSPRAGRPERGQVAGRAPAGGARRPSQRSFARLDADPVLTRVGRARAEDRYGARLRREPDRVAISPAPLRSWRHPRPLTPAAASPAPKRSPPKHRSRRSGSGPAAAGRPGWPLRWPPATCDDALSVASPSGGVVRRSHRFWRSAGCSGGGQGTRWSGGRADHMIRRRADARACADGLRGSERWEPLRDLILAGLEAGGLRHAADSAALRTASGELAARPWTPAASAATGGGSGRCRDCRSSGAPAGLFGAVRGPVGQADAG